MLLAGIWDIPYYGIEELAHDPDLIGVTVNKTSKPYVIKHEEADWWMQSGATELNGMFITFREMNTSVLGIRNLDVSTYNNAQRSMLGAYQNRLEYTIRNTDNIAENTQYAESRIRATDMAKEMVEYSKTNILEQVGHSIIAQANQNNQGVLSLLG